MNKIYLDLETFSTLDLRKCGGYRYAEEAEILLFSYAINNSPVKVWDCTSHKIPNDLSRILHNPGDLWCAHNSQFDRIIIEKVLGIKHKYWYDTMVTALQHSLPGSLDDLSKTFGLSNDKAKDKRGKALIQLFCKPLGKNRKLIRATKKTHPKEWQEFIEYARLDVEAMREIDKKLPKWNCTKYEYELWRLDQRINDKGFMVDIDLAKKVIDAVEKEKINNKKLISELTNKKVGAATQIGKLLKFIKDNYKITMSDMTRGTVISYLEDEAIPDKVKELLRIRQKSAKISVKKYDVAIKSVTKNGRIKGTTQFCGGNRTARWGGRGIQPHNFTKPKFKN